MKKIIWVFIALFVWGCSKEDNDNNHDLVLVSAKIVKSYTQSEASAVISLATIGNPDFAPFVDKIKYGVTVYYIEYNTPYNNTNIVASGLLAVPTGLVDPLLMLSFQNGTIVLHSEAPSLNLSSVEFMVLHAAAGMGLAVCIGDNIGFGASQNTVHPYLNKALFQASVINLIKASKELSNKSNSDFKLNGQLYLTGYSLGGWASLVTHHYIEKEGVDNFNLIGSSCGAGAYNLIEMRDFLFTQTNYIQPYYLPLMLYGLASSGSIDNNMSLYFSEPYASRIASLYDGKHSSGQINAELTANIPLLMKTDLIENPNAPQFANLNAALNNNSVAAWKNIKPIKFYHGTADVHVPYTISQNLVAQFRLMGQTTQKVDFITLDGANHRTGSMPMFLDVLTDITELIE